MASTSFETSFRTAPFDAVAASYDRAFTNSLIGRAQRQAVWDELDQVFHSGQRVLELNCGTGADAVHLASRGVEVFACDASLRMIEAARVRALSAEVREILRAPVEFRLLANEDIGKLWDSHKFEGFAGAFSNFAGLNCVEDLSAVARNLAQLLRPGAHVVLCLFGRLCAWEVFWYLSQGRAGTAFRRLARGARMAGLTEGATVHVRYFSIRAVTRTFAPHFRLERWKGIGVTVPPSYVEPIAERFPGLVKLAARADRWLGRWPLVRATADHVLLTFERR